MTTTTTGAVTVAAAIPMALPVTTRDGSPVLSSEEQGVTGSGSDGVASGDMGDENERLRRENAQLARELSQMRKLCYNILLLMSKYASTESIEAATPLPLPPLPSCPGAATASVLDNEEEMMSAKLFGVSIGRKRMRHDGDGEGGADGRAAACRGREGAARREKELEGGEREKGHVGPTIFFFVNDKWSHTYFLILNAT
uniref:Uncharacterized protein n=1 Tax=Oryza nivara TaxID=4536 RepID=A0A0E0HSN9_ORYNI